MLRLMWCRDYECVAEFQCHHSDPSVLHPLANVATLITIVDAATLFTQCRDFDMMSRHSSTNVVTLL